MMERDQLVPSEEVSKKTTKNHHFTIIRPALLFIIYRRP
jgi:hypothetical protein